MIAMWKFQMLNRVSWHTCCLICGRRTRRYRYCGGDTGCKSKLIEPGLIYHAESNTKGFKRKVWFSTPDWMFPWLLLRLDHSSAPDRFILFHGIGKKQYQTVWIYRPCLGMNGKMGLGTARMD